MKNSYYVKTMFGLFVVCCIITLNILFVIPAAAQQNEDDKQSDEKQIIAIAENEEAFLRFGVEVKKRYYVGEPVIFSFKFTSVGSSHEILEAEHRKYNLRAEGIFNNAGEVQVKEFVYEGSFEFLPTEPKDTKKVLFNGFESPKRKEPTYVILKSDETTSVEMNLSNRFFSEPFHPGSYKIVAKSEGGQESVAEFEVYFDEEKSTEYLIKRLQSGNDADRNGAYFYLSKYNHTALVTTLEKMLQSDNSSIKRDAAIFLSEFRRSLEVKQN